MIVDPLENFLMSVGMGCILSFAMMMIFSPDPSAMSWAKDSVAATLVGFTAFFAVAPRATWIVSRLGEVTEPTKNLVFAAVVAIMQAFVLSLSITLFHGMLRDGLSSQWIQHVLRDWAVASPIAFLALQVIHPIVSCLVGQYHGGASSKGEQETKDVEEGANDIEEEETRDSEKEDDGGSESRR